MVMLCIYFYIKTWFDCCQKLTLVKAQKELERDQTVKELNLFMFMFRVKNAFMSRFWFLFIDFYFNSSLFPLSCPANRNQGYFKMIFIQIPTLEQNDSLSNWTTGKSGL